MEANFCLSSPVQLGAYQLANRIVLAANPRCNASLLEQPAAQIDLWQSEAITYYSSLTSYGLIITEPTLIAPLDNFTHYPGIYTRQQLRGWRNITETVREQNGKIFVQLWHREEMQRLNHQERAETVRLFRQAAQNALAAEFDGIEINFQVDGFGNLTNSTMNSCSDAIENYFQLLLSIVEEVSGIWNVDKVGIKISSKLNESRLRVLDFSRNFYCLLDAISFHEVAFLHLDNCVTTKFSQANLVLPLLNLLHSIYSGKIVVSCQDWCMPEINAISNSSLDLISLNNLAKIAIY